MVGRVDKGKVPPFKCRLKIVQISGEKRIMVKICKANYRAVMLAVCVVAVVVVPLTTMRTGVDPVVANALVSSTTTSRSSRGKVIILNVRAPAFVRNAGGHELDRWYFGRRVASGAGCAACHRIGESGNAGPGVALTQIGASLSKQELEKILLDAPTPMPSFRSMPRDKLAPLVLFLSLLRGEHRAHG